MRPSGNNWLDAYHLPACNKSVDDSTQSHDPSEPQGVIHLVRSGNWVRNLEMGTLI
jgi:hypothetical protein